MAARKKSLAEELLELTNPAPKDIDPEGPAHDWDAMRLDNVDDLAESAPSARYLQAEERRTLKAEPIMGEKYRGKKTTRKEMLGDSDEEDEEEGDDIEGVMPELDIVFDDENSADGDISSSDEDMYNIEETMAEHYMESARKAAEEADELEREVESDENEYDGELAGYSGVEEDEEEDMEENIQHLKADLQGEREKAEHTKNQKILLDGMLDLRIKLQPALELANRFPQPDTFNDFLQVNSGSDLVDKFTDVKKELRSLLNTMLQLQDALRCNNEELKESVESNRKKRKAGSMTSSALTFDDAIDLDAMWELLNDEFEAFTPYQTETIEKWNAKTLFASGASLMKLKALDQSIVKHAQQLLETNRAKYIKRTQLKRDDAAILGKRRKVEDRPKTITPDEEYDEEIFDDGDFYANLLRELVESGNQETTDPIEMSRQWLRVKNQLQLKKRHRPNVDRRASKGRKLRYTEQQPLVSFMAPEPYRYPNSGTFIAEQLKLSLFSKPVITS